MRSLESDSNRPGNAPPGAGKPAVLLFGHSHLGPIRGAYRYAGGADSLGFDLIELQLLDERYQPNWEYMTNVIYHPAIEQDLRKIIAERSPSSIVASLWGNDHYVFGSVWGPDSFDFVLPEQPELGLSSAAEVIPYDVLRSYMHSRMRWIHDLLKVIGSISDVPTYHLSAPPPVASRSVVLDRAPPPVKAGMMKYGIPPSTFRYKYWRLCETISRELTAEANAHFVEPPVLSRDNRGFLRSDYAGADGLHGSEEYGALVIDQIMKILHEIPCREVG